VLSRKSLSRPSQSSGRVPENSPRRIAACFCLAFLRRKAQATTHASLGRPPNTATRQSRNNAGAPKRCQSLRLAESEPREIDP
jgi:hypothetical protein